MLVLTAVQIFKGMAVFNLKLLIVKVGKLEACGRPLFTNPVTNVDANVR